MKGYLKSHDGVFQLAPKVTTIGREGCDLIIQTQEADCQHAVIEYSDQEECFVLQDLNTERGTFVNDCCVQNAAVRLAPGDLVRFGGSGNVYELHVDTDTQLFMYPPVHQRPAWTRPLTVITEQRPPVLMTNNNESNTLPSLRSMVSTQTSTWSASPQCVKPRPPSSLRSRPLSAGSRRPQYMERDFTTMDKVYSDRPISAQTIRGGWVTGVPARTITTTHQATDMSLLQEKEQKIIRLGEECKRLAMYEKECSRREEINEQLRDEVVNLQSRLRQYDMNQTHSAMQATDGDLNQRLLVLQDDVQLKQTQINSLKEQINQMAGVGSVTQEDMNNRIMEINSLRTELERVRKDKSITTGLVSQMQRDMANKDTTISCMTRDVESLKKEMKEKDMQLVSLQAKFHRTQEAKRSEEENDARQKELAALRQRFKCSEKKLQDQLDIIAALKEELEKYHSKVGESDEIQKKTEHEMDLVKAKCQDIERAERRVRVDLEQNSKRMERFRNRLIQVTFSTPGIKAPDSEISDDELLETLKKLMDERTEMLGKLSDMNHVIKEAGSAEKVFIANSKKLKHQMNETMARLQEKGTLACRIRQEIDLIGTLSLDESNIWVKDIIKDLLQISLTWEEQIEKSLENSGINVKLSDEAPGFHVKTLHDRWQNEIKEKEMLRQQMSETDAKFKEELTQRLETMRIELEDINKAELEKVKLEEEERMNQCINEIRTSEEERRQVANAADNAKISELETHVEQLKMSLLEREELDASNKESAREALQMLEEYKSKEAELQGKISGLEADKDNEIIKLQEELDDRVKKGTSEMEGFKEQIRQHSTTICAMEERLNKVMKKNKDYQTEISSLKHTVADLRAKHSGKPVTPPKPKLLIQRPAVDVDAMKMTILGLQNEIKDLKDQMQNQHDVILNLRRDLAGANAKMSDMTGELSETQKETLEKGQKIFAQQEVELMELRQQMAKLSHIIDNQAEEIKKLNSDLSNQHAALKKCKYTCQEREVRISELEMELGLEKEEARKSLQLNEEEGRITSELTAMGAQCRGERHEQVIARQREALTELRARIKTLELSKPSLPSQDQALQQVVLLKKELSEIRASQALKESADGHSSPLEKHINMTRGMNTQNTVHEDHERSAHRETMEALEMSEQTFLTLLRGIASTLELDDIEGLRSMAHIPRDERLSLACEREKSVELITSRIKVLIERLARKDDLLQGYERDLAKLRQAEKLADRKNGQVERLANDIRTRTEESQYLRESLNRTKDKLEQEKRLNSAIKSKKTFHLENDNTKKRWPQHHCPPDDLAGKEAAKKKMANEKIRKKNYEISALKDELSNKEKVLQVARRQLITMESSMCYDDRQDPLEPPVINA